jgi:hypothetical protein
MFKTASMCACSVSTFPSNPLAVSEPRAKLSRAMNRTKDPWPAGSHSVPLPGIVEALNLIQHVGLRVVLCAVRFACRPDTAGPGGRFVRSSLIPARCDGRDAMGPPECTRD